MLSNDLAWMPEDLEDTDRWIHVLDDAEIADIGRALATAKAAGADFDTLDKKNFPLDAITETLAETLERLEHGLGLSVIRGLPVDRYTKDELRLIYWGIGLHLGTAVTQSSKGDVLGDVRNFGDDVTSTSATGRGYMSSEQLGFHTDTCDVVCLFVMRTAKSGGRSMFASAVAIRDKIARKDRSLRVKRCPTTSSRSTATPMAVSRRATSRPTSCRLRSSQMSLG